MAQPVIADDPLVTRENEFTVGLDAMGRVRISPTDVSQVIRLDQCERYLRLHSSWTASRSPCQNVNLRPCQDAPIRNRTTVFTEMAHG
jgi:hypothetical protein